HVAERDQRRIAAPALHLVVERAEARRHAGEFGIGPEELVDQRAGVGAGLAGEVGGKEIVDDVAGDVHDACPLGWRSAAAAARAALARKILDLTAPMLTPSVRS